MRQYFPILDWANNYKKEYLNGELSAGLTVGGLLVSQAYDLCYAGRIDQLRAATIPLKNRIE